MLPIGVLLPTDAPTSAFPFDCSKGRYTTLKRKSPIHNFRSYLLWVKDNAVLIRDEEGRPLLWQCVLSDITRRREAEEEVRRLNEDLERRVEKRTAQLMSALEEAEDNEELMRLSESRFRSLVQRSSDITAILEKGGPVRYVSPAVERVLGYRAGELIEERIPHFVHPDDRRSLSKQFARVVESRGETVNAEFRFRHKDGSWRHLDAVFSNLSDAPGVDGIVVNARDVTGRKEAERRYKTLVEQLPLVTYVENAESNAIEYVSPQIEAVLGHPAERYAVQRSLRYASILPEDLEWVRAEDERTDRTGEPYSVEHRRITRDGRLIWVRDEAVLIRDEEDRPLYWQGMMEDITERKEAEEELRQSMGALLALYETGQILTSTLDLEERGERLLDVMVGLFGLKAAAIDLIGADGEAEGAARPWKTKGPNEIFEATKASPEYAGARRGALTSGTLQTFRWRDGERGAASEGACLPLKVKKRVIGVVEIFGDEGLDQRNNLDLFVSLSNQAGSALENARLYNDLAEREKRLEELIGKLFTAQEEERRRIAYEVHDGLAQISLAAQQRLQTFIEDHPPNSVVRAGELDRAMELVRQTGREARRVISGLRPTVLDDFGLASALRLHVETLRKDGLEVDYDETLGDERLPAHVETALYRVAQEASNNARKHAPGAEVRLSLRIEGGVVRLEVADNGPGFDPGSVQSGGPGERVGLSSMRERVALLGGGFEINSRPGSGTKIVAEVRLPEGFDEEEGDRG